MFKFNNDYYFLIVETRISLSIPATLHESVLVWRQMSQSFTPHSPFISSGRWQFGRFSL